MTQLYISENRNQP